MKQKNPNCEEQLKQRYRNAANKKHPYYTGDIEVNEDAPVALGEDGAYVQAWTWIPKESL